MRKIFITIIILLLIFSCSNQNDRESLIKKAIKKKQKLIFFKPGNFIKLYYKNGFINCVATYSNQKKHGIYIDYTEKGILSTKTFYSNDTKLKEVQFYPQGIISRESFYKDKRQIYSIKYSKTGNKIWDNVYYGQSTIRNDIANWCSTKYNESDRTIKEVEVFSNGIQKIIKHDKSEKYVSIFSNNYNDGFIKVLYNDNSLKYNQIYKDGFPTANGILYDEDGKIVDRVPYYGYKEGMVITYYLPHPVNYIEIYDKKYSIKDLYDLGLYYNKYEFKSRSDNLVHLDEIGFDKSSDYFKEFRKKYKAFLNQQYNILKSENASDEIRDLPEMMSYIPKKKLDAVQSIISNNLADISTIYKYSFDANRYLLICLSSLQIDHYSENYKIVYLYKKNKICSKITLDRTTSIKFFKNKGKFFILTEFYGYENSGVNSYEIKNDKIVKVACVGEAV